MNVLLVSAAIVILDQVTKVFTRNSLELYQSVPVIKNFFHLTYVTNDGIAFGINIPGGNYLFTIVAVLLTGVLSWYLWQSRNKALLLRLSLAVILAGAVGNLVDRVVYGKVVDFLDFMIGSYHWYIFNIADSAVTVGMGLFLYYSFFRDSKEHITSPS